jgi:putative transposase
MRSARDWEGPAGSDTADEPRESAVGCSEDPRRVVEAWPDCLAGDGFEVHGPPRRPPSQAWRTFLKNHALDLIALDFFTVPTATFRVLFVLVVLTHSRRRLVHFNVTEHPTAEWTARQLLEACALEEASRYLIRDRDQVYGERFSHRARTLDIQEAVIAPRSPWQNAYVERVIGSIRRECLDHAIVIGEQHLREILSKYMDYYNRTRTHFYS